MKNKLWNRFIRDAHERHCVEEIGLCYFKKKKKRIKDLTVNVKLLNTIKKFKADEKANEYVIEKKNMEKVQS